MPCHGVGDPARCGILDAHNSLLLMAASTCHLIGYFIGFEKRNGIVHTPAFQQVFPNGLTCPDTLKTAPHGYDPDHPAIVDLRRKAFCAKHPSTDTTMRADEAFEAARPLVDFINTAVHF